MINKVIGTLIGTGVFLTLGVAMAHAQAFCC
jgi:amino acid permease